MKISFVQLFVYINDPLCITSIDIAIMSERYIRKNILLFIDLVLL